MKTARGTWDALLALRAQTKTSAILLGHCGGLVAKYERLLTLVKAARDDGSYDAYTTLCRAISTTYNRSTGSQDSTNEFGIPSAFIGTFYDIVFDRGTPKMTLLDGMTLTTLLTEQATLNAMFEPRDTTDMADAAYGRTSGGMFHIATGEKMVGSRSRQGSLGT